MAETSVITDAEILAAVIAPERPDFDPAVARSILTLKFSDEQTRRMRELVDRNNKGTISEAEREEMESYRRVGNLLALLQSKARISLRHAGESVD